MNKVVLGTAQFGLNYGINNKRGIIPQKEVQSILKIALKYNIDTIDTAKAYGNSETIIGSFNLIPFKIITKINNPKNVFNDIKDSLIKLKIKKLYAVLIHNFQPYYNDTTIWTSLQRLKEKNLIKKIGFSLNKPEELLYLFERKIIPDIIQIPYSIFDQRFKSLINIAKTEHIEIHSRSTFLQGVYFMNKVSLPEFLFELKPNLVKLKKLSEEFSVSISDLCLNFTLLNNNIDRVVIGIDSISNLRQNVHSIKKQNIVKSILPELYNLNVENEELVLPMNWEKT